MSENEELKPAMEWLRELPRHLYVRAMDRRREHPLPNHPVERRMALRAAFWWGAPGTTEYHYWLAANRVWVNNEISDDDE